MIFPKKPQVLYAPMLATLGGGSLRSFGRGTGGGKRPPTLDAPLGFFNYSSSSEVFFFDVDFQTAYSLGGFSSMDGMFFDTKTNIMWMERNGTPIYGMQPTGSHQGNSGDWHYISGNNINLNAQNGRYGVTFNNRVWNFAGHSSSLGITIATGQNQSGGTGWNRTNQGGISGQYYGGPNTNIEDFSLFGNFGTTHGYGWARTYTLAEGSFYTNQATTPYDDDWSSNWYDNRLGIVVNWPQNQYFANIYSTEYSAGAFKQSAGSGVTRSHFEHMGYSNSMSYGQVLFGIEASGTNPTYSKSMVYADRGGSVVGKNTNGVQGQTYTAVGNGVKTSSIFSYENECYYLAGNTGVLRIPYLGGGTLSNSPTQISYGHSSVQSWRGPTGTSGQMAVWTHDKTGWEV
tara:strand:+ start:1668 stop:2870 length:1203 start_codon:yes stop_codon:yes gene_type:complete